MVLGLISSSVYSQLEVENAIAIDGDKNGKYGTVEIKFSLGVNDSEIETSAITKNDWEFSLDLLFITDVKTPSDFYTEVSCIASEKNRCKNIWFELLPICSINELFGFLNFKDFSL